VDFLTELLSNKVLISAVCGWFFSQALKMIIESVKGGFSLSRLRGGGGMPSAHSSTVSSLAVSTLITDGAGSSQAAIAFFLAVIVIYDAMGVRYTTGRQSRILNRLRDREKEAGEEPLFDEQLEEKMGHTVPEIAAGIVLGTLTAIIVCSLMR